MQDRTISLSCVAAIAMWVGAVVLIGSGTIVALVNHQDYLAAVLALMAHGLVLSAGAATMSIRYMFKRQNHFLRSAFELGRDAGPAPVRSVR